ncbi:antitoxin PaaA2 family protein [Pseudomonas syringae]
MEASLADSRPAIPHDEVERRMAERLARLRHRRAS